MFFKKAHHKVTKYLGYFCKKFCHQELSKIAQSGHTGETYLGKILQIFAPIFLKRGNDNLAQKFNKNIFLKEQ